MSQLIALIIAIALGAIVTAIGYVFLGDAFSNNTPKAIAQILINHGSQLEVAMMAYKVANKNTSAFETDYALTLSNDGAGAAGTTNGLIPENYLSSELTPPLEFDYEIITYNSTKYLIAQSTNISREVCDEINNTLKKITDTLIANSPLLSGNEAQGALLNNKYICIENITDADEHILIYNIGK